MVLKMTLYEIAEEILNVFDPETGEILDEEKLAGLEMEHDKKVENIALYIKNLESDAEQIKAEKNALAAREKTAKNKADGLRKYLSGYLAGQKFSTPKVAISFRSSTSVVADVAELMKSDIGAEYLKYTDPTADKVAIKKALQEGVKLPGCVLVTNQNMQIK